MKSGKQKAPESLAKRISQDHLTHWKPLAAIMLLAGKAVIPLAHLEADRLFRNR